MSGERYIVVEGTKKKRQRIPFGFWAEPDLKMTTTTSRSYMNFLVNGYENFVNSNGFIGIHVDSKKYDIPTSHDDITSPAFWLHDQDVIVLKDVGFDCDGIRVFY